MNENIKARLEEAVEKKAEGTLPKLRAAIARCRFFAVLSPIAAPLLLLKFVMSFDDFGVLDVCWYVVSVAFFVLNTIYCRRILKLMPSRGYQAMVSPLGILLASNKWMMVGVLSVAVLKMIMVEDSGSGIGFEGFLTLIFSASPIVILWKNYETFDSGRKEILETFV